MTLLARAGHLSTIVLSKRSISPSRGCILSNEHVERRLAAVLAADVAGSCRLIGIDEEGTLAQLKALRETLFDPKITEHRGRIVKNTGDGALVEFASVVDAVRSADAHRQILGKIGLDYDDMGPQVLKNIAEPMRVWRIRANGLAATAPNHRPVDDTEPLALPDKPSIAVLPFQNMSGDPA